jgi:hypothetical protein|uniref:Uncharacterized protein n=1 Tax=Picea glauca TaxID=3330 RepID=A0A101M3S3_PICGL|nr:hypothetical protein ABT39_MTgene195 [Picea glauca]
MSRMAGSGDGEDPNFCSPGSNDFLADAPQKEEDTMMEEVEDEVEGIVYPSRTTVLSTISAPPSPLDQL